jgi:phosphoglucosamine mutase
VWADSANLGKTRRLDDAAGRYIEFCKSTFANDLTLKGVRIVVDGAHGAAYQIAPKVFHELGAEVFAIGCAPDGLNINHEVGATHPEALVDAVQGQGRLRHRAGRRCRPAADWWTPGRLYNGDELLYLMADDRLGRDEHVPGVVGHADDQHGGRGGAEGKRRAVRARQGR